MGETHGKPDSKITRSRPELLFGNQCICGRLETIFRRNKIDHQIETQLYIDIYHASVVAWFFVAGHVVLLLQRLDSSGEMILKGSKMNSHG